MQRNSLWSAITLAVLSGGWLPSARAQEQIKPYFLVIVDTSGSMAWCAGGTQATNGGNDCTCYASGACSGAFKTNRCGFPSNKIGDAKCALQRIIDSTG